MGLLIALLGMSAWFISFNCMVYNSLEEDEREERELAEMMRKKWE